MPSASNPLLAPPYVVLSHGGSCSHRLKHLEKGDRRDLRTRWKTQNYQASGSTKFLGDYMGSNGISVAMDELGKNLSKLVQLEEDDCSSFSDGDDENGKTESDDFPIPCNSEENFFDIASPSTSGIKRSPETPHKLVSSMKGTREKLGLSRKNLTVTWSPDVYDPVPSSESHTVKGKVKKSRRDKERDNGHGKRSKKGQKGNGKDKKQHRKHGGKSSDRFVHLPENLNELCSGSSALGFHLTSLCA